MRQSKIKDGRSGRTRRGEITPRGGLVEAMKGENLKLQQRIAKLEVQLVTARNRIAILEKERSTGLENLSDAELLERIHTLDRKLESSKK